jgi:D-methionine transport system ATP-binding protein
MTITMIELRNVVKHYNNVKAVDGVKLVIPDKTIFGIIGKSGAGKSTLLRLASLLEKPDSGEVFYGENRVDNLLGKPLLEKRRNMGMIFQNFHLFVSRNVEKNVSYPLEIAGMSKSQIYSRVGELLEMVNITEKRFSRIKELSGGQKQRVAIARALAANPGVLFCDEATSALDPQTTREVLALLKNLQAQFNLTLVVVTHQMEVIRSLCTQVAVLDAGKIVEQGGVAEVFERPQHNVTKELVADEKPPIRSTHGQ